MPQEQNLICNSSVQKEQFYPQIVKLRICWKTWWFPFITLLQEPGKSDWSIWWTSFTEKCLWEFSTSVVYILSSWRRTCPPAIPSFLNYFQCWLIKGDIFSRCCDFLCTLLLLHPLRHSFPGDEWNVSVRCILDKVRVWSKWRLFCFSVFG